MDWVTILEGERSIADAAYHGGNDNKKTEW